MAWSFLTRKWNRLDCVWTCVDDAKMLITFHGILMTRHVLAMMATLVLVRDQWKTSSLTKFFEVLYDFNRRMDQKFYHYVLSKLTTK